MIMVTCCVYGCSNRSDRNQRKPGVSFHKFPRENSLRDKWINAVKRVNWKPSGCSVVCSEHFSVMYLNRTFASGHTELRENAVPTIFPSYPPHLQPRQLKIEPGLTDNTFHDDTMDTIVGCGKLKKKVLKHFDSMIRVDSENTTFIKEFKKEVPEHSDSMIEIENTTFKKEEENCQITDMKLKIEPGLTDDDFHDDTMDTIVGCSQLNKKISEHSDSMIDIENTTFIKQEEDEKYQNTYIKIKIEPGLTNSDFQSHEYTMNSVERCNQLKGVSFDVQPDMKKVMSTDKCQLIGIDSASTNFFDMDGMREDCKAFGEFLARELQKLNSDDSRSHLKEIIKRAILEVSEGEIKREKVD